MRTQRSNCLKQAKPGYGKGWWGIAPIVMAGVCAAFAANVPFVAFADSALPIAFKIADAVVVKAVFADKRDVGNIDAAAAEITNAIFKTTGRMPAVHADGTEPATAKAAIHLGPTAAAKAAGLADVALRRGDWRVKCEPGRAFLYGTTAYAVTRATFDFMEKVCDYHVLTPDGDDVFTPNRACAAFVSDRTVRPAIYDRLVSYGWDVNNSYKSPVTYKRWRRYARAMGNDRDCPLVPEGKFRLSQQVRRCHSTFEYLPPDKWFKDHPEYYSMNPEGKRSATPQFKSQLCYTNPDTYRHVLESLERFVEADRKATPDDPPLIYDFTQQDNSDFLCLCPECKKVIAKYNRVEGGRKEGGDAGLQLEFVNRLARDIDKKYPGVQIRTFAYVSTERAPKPGTISVEPNVWIWWCDVYSHSDHTISLDTPGSFNLLQKQELDEWLQLTRNIQGWDYMLGTDDFPEVSVDALKADLGYFASCGMQILYQQMDYKGQPLHELNYYVASKLMEDPSRDVDSLMRTFCRSYGDAADEMYGALQYLRHEIKAHPAKTPNDWHQRMLPWLQDPSVLQRFGILTKAAYDKLPPGGKRARVARIMASTCKSLMKTFKKDPAAAKEFAAAKEGYRRYGIETARTAFMEPKDRPAAEAKVEETLELLDLRFNDLPAALKSVPADELVCVDYHYGRKVVDDAVSERGRAASAPECEKAPVACGLYDRATKASFPFSITASDLTPGRYSWVKLGKCRMGSDSLFWFSKAWRGYFQLKDDFYILSDGLETDPNWYELWASAREGDGMFLVDRLAFRRVEP